MKIKTVLLSILALLIISSALLFWRYTYVQGRYAQDYVALEKDIFLTDSEGRGFSDKVKQDIEAKFPDDKIKLTFFKYAKAKRDLLRSKTEDEYLVRFKKSISYLNCVSYLVDNSKNPQILDNSHLVVSIVIDNESMKNFELYLEQYKFNTKEVDDEALRIINDSLLSVSSEKDFNEKCN